MSIMNSQRAEVMDIKRDRIEHRRKILTNEDSERLCELYREYNWLEELLRETPTDAVLIRRYHEVGVKIVTITGEKNLEY